MTREKNNFLENDIRTHPHYGHVIKLFLELEFQHKGNKQTKRANSQQTLVVFLAEMDSENEII